MENTNRNAVFSIGDKVARIAFTNCSGEFMPAIHGLTVTHLNHVTGQSIPDYYRVTAHDLNGWQMCEGAERFFMLDSKAGERP